MSVFRSVSMWLRGRGRPGAAVRKPARPRLGLESLDARDVPAVFHVTTLADGGDGSIRAAVAQADVHPGADAIVFDDGLTGTIALTGGELDITDDLAIKGSGADKLTVSGSNLSRVFQVEAGETVSISALTIAGGNAGTGSGGGIDNFGMLTVNDSVFSGNAAANGGGLANEVGATATVSDSTFAGNFGGGLTNSRTATLTVSDSTFTGNTESGLTNSGTATVRDSAFTGNSSSFRGGGIFNGGQGTLMVSGSTFTGNSAQTIGGGICMNSGKVTV